MSRLREIRCEKGLTQQGASELLGVSLRSYISYENEYKKAETLKYKCMADILENYVPLDEERGILSVEDIRRGCEAVFSEYPVKYCFLFGSYAKGLARENSDVDLLVSTDITGLRFFGMAEKLRNELKKKVDVLDLKQLAGNSGLIDEILKDGIKIYEQSER